MKTRKKKNVEDVIFDILSDNRAHSIVELTRKTDRQHSTILQAFTEIRRVGKKQGISVEKSYSGKGIWKYKLVCN